MLKTGQIVGISIGVAASLLLISLGLIAVMVKIFRKGIKSSVKGKLPCNVKDKDALPDVSPEDGVTPLESLPVKNLGDSGQSGNNWQSGDSGQSGNNGQKYQNPGIDTRVKNPYGAVIGNPYGRGVDIKTKRAHLFQAKHDLKVYKDIQSRLINKLNECTIGMVDCFKKNTPFLLEMSNLDINGSIFELVYEIEALKNVDDYGKLQVAAEVERFIQSSARWVRGAIRAGDVMWSDKILRISPEGLRAAFRDICKMKARLPQREAEEAADQFVCLYKDFIRNGDVFKDCDRKMADEIMDNFGVFNEADNNLEIHSNRGETESNLNNKIKRLEEEIAEQQGGR